jgi:glycosyltransferase involved in cell wall biosynthesis
VECLTFRPHGVDITEFPDHERLIAKGTKVHAFPNMLRAGVFIYQACRRFDVVHADGCWEPICILAILVARTRGVINVVTPHETLTENELRRTRSMMRLAIKRLLRFYYAFMADCIVYSSPLEQRDSLRHSNPVVIAHPVYDDVDGDRPAEFRSGFAAPGRIQFGYLGRFHPKKKLEDIVTAAVKTANVSLLVAGGGPKDYEDKIRLLACGNGNVTWPGFVTKDRREEFFRTIDFLVLASEYECFGMAAAEALVRGIPVIVTEAVGVAEDVKRTNGGFLVEGGVDSLVKVFTMCSRLTSDEYRELQKNAWNAGQSYSYSAHGEAQRRTYADLLKKARRHS